MINQPALFKKANIYKKFTVMQNIIINKFFH
jgi:hypothetical protein